MDATATASDNTHQRSVTTGDIDKHTNSGHAQMISKCGQCPKCDTKCSGLRNTSHLHAEHDIAKLRVLQSPDAGSGLNDTMAKKYAMSVMAASVAETVTYPLDLTKTR